MHYKPTGDERDWQGVCVKCGKMSSTKLINLVEDDKEVKRIEKDLAKKRAFYRYLGYNEFEIDDILGPEEDPPGDWREVTKCCNSEDFIPITYAEKCPKCKQWYDERRGCNCQTGVK